MVEEVFAVGVVVDVGRLGRDCRVAVVVERVGRVPVGIVVEVDVLGGPVARPVGPAVVGVGLGCDGRPVARGEAGEGLREHVAELVVGAARRDVDLVRRARRAAAAGNRERLRQVGIFIDVEIALARGIEVGLQVGLADHHPGPGLAALLRAEHEVLARGPPGAGAQLHRLDLVGIILAVVPDAVGIRLAVGRAGQKQVVLRGESLGDVVEPIGIGIETAAAHLDVRWRDHHHVLAGQFAAIVGQRVRGRGAVVEGREYRLLRLSIAAILRRAVVVGHRHLGIERETRDRRQVARVAPLAEQRVFELRVAVLVRGDVDRDIGFGGDQRGEVIGMVAGAGRRQRLALQDQVEGRAVRRRRRGVGEVDRDGISVRGRVQGAVLELAAIDQGREVRFARGRRAVPQIGPDAGIVRTGLAARLSRDLRDEGIGHLKRESHRRRSCHFALLFTVAERGRGELWFIRPHTSRGSSQSAQNLPVLVRYGNASDGEHGLNF